MTAPARPGAAAPHLLFAFAPTMDEHDRFFTAHPGSLLHAIAPLVHGMDTGDIAGTYCDRIYHPKVLSAAALDLWRAMLVRERPTHVAISSTYDSWHVALRLSRLTRKLVPEAVIVHGGPHLDEVLEPFVLARTPTLDPLSRGAADVIDFAVAGDGEHALVWLATTTAGAESGADAVRRAAAAADGVRSLPGTGHIVFGKGTHRTSLKFRNPMPLDSLPFPPRHLLPVADLFDFDCFTDRAGRRRPTASMLTHRGCRARCNFCSEGLPYRGRSHRHILDEAEQLASAGVRAVFLDDSTVQDDPEFEGLLAGFHRLGLEVGALTRFDQISDVDALHRMQQRGLVYLYASVEQYSDASLDLMHKKLRTRQIDQGVRNCADAGIRLGVSLLFGLPYETPEGVRATLEYAARLRDRELVQYVSMSLFSFHPKTPLGQLNRTLLQDFDFSTAPPNLTEPFTDFEEGSWFHPDHVTAEYAGAVSAEARDRFGDRLVRELARHRGDVGPVAATGA